MDAANSPHIVIVGAGMSGLCLAIQLKRAGFHNITLLEASSEVGGTWNKNTYPNAGCDVPSYLYSYSFASNHRWSMKYARQPEILDYFRLCAERFDVRRSIRFETMVESATFDEATGRWRVRTDEGDEIVADVFVSAVGQLNRPAIPSFQSADVFEGEAWHSAQWNHNYDLAGKNVAVVGNGASAVQFMPIIAEQCKKVVLFQRTASWIHPLHNYRYPKWAQRCMRWIPFAAKLHRLSIFLSCEWRIVAFREGSKLNKEYARWLRRQMRRRLPNEDWEKLIPTYAPGCKRILLSSDYLETLSRDDVEVVLDPITGFTKDQIVTGESSYDVDAVIYATGFRATEFLQPMTIRGRGGKTLEQEWKARPKAYLGLAVPEFPNLFMLYGPNTNLGHNSIIYMVEQQVNFIIKCLKRMRNRSANTIEVRREALDQYDAQVQSELASSVWAGDCTNWYKSADGTIPNNWWGSAMAYRRRLRRPRFDNFKFGTAKDAAASGEG